VIGAWSLPFPLGCFLFPIMVLTIPQRDDEVNVCSDKVKEGLVFGSGRSDPVLGSGLGLAVGGLVAVATGATAAMAATPATVNRVVGFGMGGDRRGGAVVAGLGRVAKRQPLPRVG